MEKSYKYRIYPNKKQRELLAKTFGCCRFVYNYFLEKSSKDYKQNNISYSTYSASKELSRLKQEFEWLNEPDKCALQNSLRDLESAYKMFFKGFGYPKFKSKRTHRYSYRTQNYNKGTAIQVVDKKIKLPKLGWVKYKDKQIPQGRILNATISQVPSGKYYVSICCTEVYFEEYPKTNKFVGIDLGIKDFAITSNGDKFDNPKYLEKSLNKIKKLHTALNRKTRGGENWKKARVKLAKAYEKVTNQRLDHRQKLSTKLITEYDILCVEDLKSNELTKDNLCSTNRNINDASWTAFINELEYKANWYGKTVIKVDQYYASSQICHCCGYKYSGVKDLSVRNWICPSCNAKLDRDVNAAINILNEGLNKKS